MPYFISCLLLKLYCKKEKKDKSPCYRGTLYWGLLIYFLYPYILTNYVCEEQMTSGNLAALHHLLFADLVKFRELIKD